MALVYYDPEMTMRAARAQYFDVNHFGESGGYDDAWVDFKLGPVPFPFPNTAGRIRAVKVHDLHHILTAYDTDLIGEFEIGAWEVGAGCKDFYAAWFLNLGGLAAGAFAAPKRTFRAYLRGRKTESLYGRSLDEMLDRSVADMRRETRADDPIPSATFGDVLRFTAWFACGAVAMSVFGVVGFFAAPLALLFGLRKNKVKAESAAA